MLQGTLDPATPYAGAQNAHKLLPSARMVVVEGGGNHGQSFSQPPDACVQGYLNAYLATGALPQGAGLVNATCPAVAGSGAGQLTATAPFEMRISGAIAPCRLALCCG